MMMQPMDCRLPSRRIVYALGAAFVVATLLLFQFHLLSSPTSGQRSQSWAAASDPMRDIRNSTLGFQKIFVVGLPSRSDRRDGMVLQAALSGIQVEFIDGVLGKDVLEKAVPKFSEDAKGLSDASIGSWRAHMNAVREIVHRNLSSALILEDDTDWDIRIRDQLHDFALSAHALMQPLRGRPGVYADPTYPQPSGDSTAPVPEMDFHRLPATTPPTTSPYGDNWDLLWVGHCGMHFPFRDSKTVPQARIIRLDDETVAPKRNLWTINTPFTLKDDYPEHTRAYHHAQEGVCSLGYALSQRGAQKLLQEVALKDVGAAYDILLRFYCEGDKGRRAGRQCLATQPSLFHHHRPAGPASANSDISNHGANGEINEKALTDMVRWSVRLNADALMEGRTDFVDQYPDE